eukprot:SAG31_NODE_9673_length_1243_cov_1.499126_2_plen_141_part_01
MVTTVSLPLRCSIAQSTMIPWHDSNVGMSCVTAYIARRYVDHVDGGLKAFFSTVTTGGGSALKGLLARASENVAGALATAELTEEAETECLAMIDECTADSEVPASDDCIESLISRLMTLPALHPVAIDKLTACLAKDSIP